MSDLTLKSFFSEDETRPVADLLDRHAVAEILRSAAAIPAAVLPGVTKALEGALEGFFDIKLGPVLQASWQTLGAIDGAIKATKADAQAKVYVPLLDHKITSTHKPHVDLVMGGKTLAGLGFEIALTLELKGVQLEVAKGRLHGLTAGAALGQGVFSFAGRPLLQRSTPPLNLPGRVSFKAPEDGASEPRPATG